MSRATIIDPNPTEATDRSEARTPDSAELSPERAPADLLVTERETSLEEIVGDRGLDARLAAAVARDVSRQLHVLHRHGVHHGKISAKNVNVGDDASVDISLPARDDEQVEDAEAFSNDLRDVGALVRYLVGGEEAAAELPKMLERIVSRAEKGLSAEGYRSAARLAAALDRYLVLTEWGLIER